MLRKMVLLNATTGGKKPVEDTVTGNPVTFLTDLAKPLKSCLAAWTPTQSGSGDPSPDNVRPISGMDGVTVWHGQNLYDYTDNESGFINSNGGHQQNELWQTSDFIPVSGSAIVYEGITTPGTSPYSAWFNEGKTVISTFKQQTGKNTLTIPSGAKYVRFSLLEQNDIDDVHTFKLYCPTTYAVEFPALGRNLFDVNAITDGKQLDTSDGNKEVTNAAACISDYIPVKKGEPVYIPQTQTGRRWFYGTDKVAEEYLNNASAQAYTPPHDGYIRVTINKTLVDINTFQISYGSTAQPFEPYTNTVYGGTLDLTTGVLTAEWKAVAMSAMGFSYRSAWSCWVASAIENAEIVSSNSVATKAMTAEAKAVVASGYTSSHAQNTFCQNNSGSWFFDNGSDTDAPEGYLIVPIVTPQTYQLTPQQITALIGNNTMWSDANGDCEVKYLKKG